MLFRLPTAKQKEEVPEACRANLFYPLFSRGPGGDPQKLSRIVECCFAAQRT